MFLDMVNCPQAVNLDSVDSFSVTENVFHILFKDGRDLKYNYEQPDEAREAYIQTMENINTSSQNHCGVAYAYLGLYTSIG